LEGLDQQESFQDRQADLIDILITVPIEDIMDITEDIMDMDGIDHGIGDGGIHRCGLVIIIDLGIILPCMLVEESLLQLFSHC